MMEKLAQADEGGGARPPPFTTVTITYKVAVYAAPAEWADKLTLFHLYQYVYSVVKTFNVARTLRTSVLDFDNYSLNGWQKAIVL
jgi:hypothetical protein